MVPQVDFGQTADGLGRQVHHGFVGYQRCVLVDHQNTGFRVTPEIVEELGLGSPNGVPVVHLTGQGQATANFVRHVILECCETTSAAKCVAFRA